MAKYYGSQWVTLTSGQEVNNLISTALTDAGWTNLGAGQFQAVFGGRTSTISHAGASWLSGGYLIMNGQLAYFPVFGYTSGVQVWVMISADTDFFYISVQGPNAGATGALDATYGSPRAFAMLTTIEPANAGDSDPDALQIVARSHANASNSMNVPTVIQKKGPSGASNALAELMCMRPAIQDISSVGDLPPSFKSGSNFFGSRFVVVDQTWGLRGTLKNVAFASENYAMVGDSASPFSLGSEYIRAGVRYAVDVPCGSPSATSAVYYSPLGLCTVLPTNQANLVSTGTLCGPRIFVKKGDGTV